MAKDFDTMEDSNRSANADIHCVSDPVRRVWLQGGLGALAAGFWAPWLAGCASAGSAGTGPLLGFKSVPVNDKDTLVVPDGYSALAIAAWGEPVGIPGRMPAWARLASSRVIRPCLSMATTDELTPKLRSDDSGSVPARTSSRSWAAAASKLATVVIATKPPGSVVT